jgi:hypothetical protein
MAHHSDKQFYETTAKILHDDMPLHDRRDIRYFMNHLLTHSDHPEHDPASYDFLGNLHHGNGQHHLGRAYHAVANFKRATANMPALPPPQPSPQPIRVRKSKYPHSGGTTPPASFLQFAARHSPHRPQHMADGGADDGDRVSDIANDLARPAMQFEQMQPGYQMAQNSPQAQLFRLSPMYRNAINSPAYNLAKLRYRYGQR